MAREYLEISIKDEGTWEGERTLGGDRAIKFVGSPSLVVIGIAWNKGLDLEAECDGYGPGQGTNGDWSGIRDSSLPAQEVMLALALEFLGSEHLVYSPSGKA